MSEAVPQPPQGRAATPQGNFGSVAAKGSFINTAQWFVNKLATAAAMLLIAHYLKPDDYGVATQALAIAQFMVVFLPLTMGDVLIAHPRRFEMLVPTARRLTMWIGIATCVLMLATIPIFLGIYSKYPAGWLGGLLAVAALRPVVDAALMVPLARLRTALAYRGIAVIEGAVQLGVTALSLVFAAFGLRSASLVAPQVIGTGVRAVVYRRVASGTGTGRFHKGLARILMRAFVPAAIAQYIHNVIVMLEVLVLGYVSGDYQTGLFAFAFTIAAQANTVVAYQLGVVLQPIFGRLQDDPARQVSGFLRVQRVLGLVCVPISLTQAVLAEPLFRIAFAERYLPAVPVFQVISVAQAFYFATGPSMSCLRSQRRFTTFFWWQGVQLLISLPLYWVGAQWSGALGTAVASGVAWAISAPIVVWLCTRVVKRAHAGAVLGIFIKPWLVGLPIFAAAGLGVRWLAQFGSTGDLASLFVLGPAAALGAIGAASLFDAEMRTLSGRAFGAVKSRLSRRGR